MGKLTITRLCLLVMLGALPGLAVAHSRGERNSLWRPDHAGSAGRWVVSGRALRTAFPRRVSPVLSRPSAPVRMGLLWDGPANVRWELRTWSQRFGWSPWEPLRRVFSERLLHVSHLDTPDETLRLQLRYEGRGHPTYLALSWLTRLGEPGAVSRTSAPAAEPRSSFGTSTQALTTPFLPRSAWKAKPAKCSSSNPTKKYIAVHHTAGPNNDKSAPDVRMRQIQSFHQNSRGWCDIAYHILISQDGRKWEGRPATVLGSHVGASNSNNLGICFFGTFTSLTPSTKMLCAGATLIDWAVKKFGISRSRSVIRGHREHPRQSTTCPGNGIINEMNKMVAGTTGFCGSTSTPLNAKLSGRKALDAYGPHYGQSYSLCPGQPFRLSFSLTNTGTITWIDNGRTGLGQSVRLGFRGGERFGAPTRISVNSASLKTVKPGQQVTFTFAAKAPTKPGDYKTEWQLVSEGVQWFGVKVSLTFRVSGAPVGAGASCKSGKKGLCATGKTQCVSGKLACVATVTPSAETCDGKDNDCDGKTDEGCECKAGETQACYSGPAGTRDKGGCVSGRQACLNGKWGPCNGQRLPGKEVCDDKDNDCDGAVDNGNPGGGQFCNPSSSGGPCTEGSTACKQGRLVCVPAPGCAAKEPGAPDQSEPPPTDRREPQTPDAGAPERPIRPEPPARADASSGREVIQLGGKACASRKDCLNGQDCVSGLCKKLPAGEQGCGCSASLHRDAPTHWLLALLLLLLVRRRRR